MTEQIKKNQIVLILFLSLIIFIAGSLIFFDLNSDKSKIKKAGLTIKNQVEAWSQPYFTPHFPQRLMNLAAEKAITSQGLLAFNEKLERMASQCDCRYVESQCVQTRIRCKIGEIKTFGDPCPDRERIEEQQREVKVGIKRLSDLQMILKKEMEMGLEEELATLRPDVAEELRTNLNKLLQTSQEISAIAQKNSKLPADCLAEKCQAACRQGISFRLEACLNPGQQKPMEVVFDIGVGLDDLKLGEVGIKNINLNLPQEINFPISLDNIPSFTIPLPDLRINFPEIPIAELRKTGTLKGLETRPIIFQPPSPTLPEIPLLELSSLRTSKHQPYQCGIAQGREGNPYIEAEWYFQTFNWFAEKCQELPGIKGGMGVPTEKLKQCFDPRNVHSTIIKECNDLWQAFQQEEGHTINLPPICQSLGMPGLGRARAKERECKNLFNQEKKPIPADCYLEIRYDNDIPYATPESIKKVLETLENKCNQLKKEERRQAPDPCKFIPLFTGKLEKPAPYEFSPSPQNCPAQNINDHPSSMVGFPASFPTIPKIILPDIIIPDVELPSLSLLPFFEAKLPSIIVEDLALPDLELCNLDACKDIFPDLRFQLPFLNIPMIQVPGIQLPDINVPIEGIGLVRIPLPEISMDGISYPSIPFNFQQLLNLGNLITPEILLPEIQLPQPRFHFGFKGLNIDLTNLLLGLVAKYFNIPSGCIGINFNFIPLRIILPQIHIAFPEFPRIPEIPYCKTISEFCQKMETKLKEVVDKADEIEKVINQTFQKEIQTKLDQAALTINQRLTNAIQTQINQRAQLIKNKIENHIRINARIEAGFLKIPPLVYSLPDITTPEIPLANLVPLPDKIPIPWPEKLRKITLKREITYELPTIPLSKLSYEREIPIPLPGLQLPSVSFSFGANEYPDCEGQNARGGNPCPTKQIRSNLERIEQLKGQTKETSQKIIEILR
jgi:hypothetical protein